MDSLETPAHQTLRAVVVGACDPSLADLLADALHELGVVIDEKAPPDLVLAVVDRTDVGATMRAAREVARGAPVAAVLPFPEPRMVRDVMAAGASACFELDRPISTLLSDLMPLVAERREPGTASQQVRAALTFRLGERARAALVENVATAALEDAIGRIEQAVRLDSFVRHVTRPDVVEPRFRFGPHARLEALMLHLDPALLDRLEAIIADEHDRATTRHVG